MSSIKNDANLRINENSSEVKKHIQFAKKCFDEGNCFFAACWGLQVSVSASGGKCRVAPNGAHTGIAQNNITYVPIGYAPTNGIQKFYYTPEKDNAGQIMEVKNQWKSCKYNKKLECIIKLI